MADDDDDDDDNDDDQTKLREAGEGRQVGVVVGSVGRVEVFLIASVRASIFGRPRRLCRYRHVHPSPSGRYLSSVKSYISVSWA